MINTDFLILTGVGKEVIIGRATLGRKQLGGERVLSVEFLVLSYIKGGVGGNWEDNKRNCEVMHL